MPTETRSRPPRYQNFTFLVYPDSAVEDWLEILRNYRVPMYVSPLHDRDVDEHGEVKKAHYHVMVMYDSLKPLDCLDELIETIHGVKPPTQDFVVKSKRAYARYLLHYDDPAKYPYYLDSRVTALSGADDYDELIKSKSQQEFDELQTMQDMQDYCEKKQIYNFAAFTRLCRVTGNDEWFRCLRVNAYYFHAWFKSFNDPRTMQAFETVDNILKNQGGRENESDNR